MDYLEIKSHQIKQLFYEGESARGLLKDFHGAVDDYLESCKTEGKEPETQ